MNHTAARFRPLMFLGCIGLSICSVFAAGAAPHPTNGQPIDTTARRQGFAAPLTGKVCSFSYSLQLDYPWPTQGCEFQLDTHAGKVLRVNVDATSAQGLAADGACRLALDSLKSGADIAVQEWVDGSGDVVKVTMVR